MAILCYYCRCFTQQILHILPFSTSCKLPQSGQNPYQFLLIIVPNAFCGTVTGGHEPQAQLRQHLTAHVGCHHDLSLKAVTQSPVGGQRVSQLSQVLIAFCANCTADLLGLQDGLWRPDSTAGAFGEGQGANLVLGQKVLETLFDPVQAIQTLLHLLCLKKTEKKAVYWGFVLNIHTYDSLTELLSQFVCLKMAAAHIKRQWSQKIIWTNN